MCLECAFINNTCILRIITSPFRLKPGTLFDVLHTYIPHTFHIHSYFCTAISVSNHIRNIFTVHWTFSFVVSLINQELYFFVRAYPAIYRNIIITKLKEDCGSYHTYASLPSGKHIKIQARNNRLHRFLLVFACG